MQWHQLDHVQTICTLLQTDNHTNTSSLDFLQAGCSSNQQCQSTEGQCFFTQINENRMTVIEAAVLQVDSNDLSLRSVSSIEDAAAPPQPTPAPLKYVCLSRDNTLLLLQALPPRTLRTVYWCFQAYPFLLFPTAGVAFGRHRCVFLS